MRGNNLIPRIVYLANNLVKNENIVLFRSTKTKSYYQQNLTVAPLRRYISGRNKMIPRGKTEGQ